MTLSVVIALFLLSIVQEGSATTFSTPAPVSNTYRSIQCIVQDRFRDDVLFVCAQNAIMEFNLKTQQYSPIAGSYRHQGYSEGTGSAARFKTPSDVVQLDENRLIVSDTYNYCLRWIVNNSTSVLAGSCTDVLGGYDDSDITDLTYARFSDVHGLLLMETYLLLVCDNFNGIRQINLLTGLVSTVVKGEGYLSHPEHIACLYPDCSNIFVVTDLTQNHLFRYNRTSASTQLIAAGRNPDIKTNAQPLIERKLKWPSAIALLNQDQLLVADETRFGIVILIHLQNRSSEIAIPEVIGASDLLLHNNDTLYISTASGIYKSEINPKATASQLIDPSVIIIAVLVTVGVCFVVGALLVFNYLRWRKNKREDQLHQNLYQSTAPDIDGNFTHFTSFNKHEAPPPSNMSAPPTAQTSDASSAATPNLRWPSALPVYTRASEGTESVAKY